MAPGQQQQTRRGADFAYSLRQEPARSARALAELEDQRPAQRTSSGSTNLRNSGGRQQNTTAQRAPAPAPPARRVERDSFSSTSNSMPFPEYPLRAGRDENPFGGGRVRRGSEGGQGRQLVLHRLRMDERDLQADAGVPTPTAQRANDAARWVREQQQRGSLDPRLPDTEDEEHGGPVNAPPAIPQALHIPAPMRFSMALSRPNRLPLALTLRPADLYGMRFDGTFVIQDYASMTVWGVREVVALFAQTPALVQPADFDLSRQLGFDAVDLEDSVGSIVLFEVAGIEVEDEADRACIEAFIRALRTAALHTGVHYGGRASDHAVNAALRAFLRGGYAVPVVRYVIDRFLNGVQGVDHQLDSIVGI